MHLPGRKRPTLAQIVRFCIQSSASKKTSVLLLCSLLSSLFGGIASVITLTLVSRLISAFGHDLFRVAVSIVAWGVLAGIMRLFAQTLLAKVTTDVLVGLRIRICIAVSRADLEVLDAVGSAQLLAAFTELLPPISIAFSQIPTFSLQAITVAGGFVYMTWLSWRAAMLTVAGGLLALLLFLWSHKRAEDLFSRALTSYNQTLKGFREIIEGARELKMNSAMRDAHLNSAVCEPSREFAQFKVRSSRLYAFSDSFSGIALFTLIGTVIFIAHWSSDVRVSLAYIVTLVFVSSPLQGVVSFFPVLGQAAVSLRDLQILTAQLDDNTIELSLNCPRLDNWHHISLREVVFSYGHSFGKPRFCVGPINVSIHRGETIFVVGSNGSGKTTFIKLLAGLYNPTDGVICVDECRIVRELQQAYRSLFSVIFSDHFLFEHLYGLMDVDIRANEHLKEFGLDGSVSVSNATFSTIKLSQGQRKRLALLRAMLDDRTIFVFDEWAAEQDPDFREVFYTKILRALKEVGKTTIVVTHDERFIGLADRTLRFGQGRCVEVKSAETCRAADAVI